MSHRADLVTAANSTTPEAAALASGRAPWFSGAAPIEVFAATVAALWPIAISPVVQSYTFTPKVAILLLVTAVGGPLLLRLALAGTGAARAALAFLLVALVSALSSASPLVGLFGTYSWGTGWLFWCGVASAWATGASLTARGRQLLVSGLLVGASVNAAVAVAQEALRLRSPVLGLYQGTQADGLMGNPIYLESILLGALALTLVRTCRSSWRWSVVASLLAAALELSGERFAVALLALLACYALAAFRSPRAAGYVAAVGAGYGLAYVSTTRLLHERLGASVVSNPRVTLWRTLLHALAHRVPLGFGPGQTMAAATAYQPLALARRLPVATYFTDAHDLVLEVAVTTGALGLLAFLGFAALSLRRASGALLGFAAMALAVELVEPLNVCVTPIALLALGAAGASAEPGRRSAGRPVQLALRSLLVAVALGSAALVLVGDLELDRGLLHYDYASTARAAELLAVWPEPALDAAQVATYRSIGARAPRYWLAEARHWYAEAASRDPSNTQIWAELAGSDVALGRHARAVSEYRRALQLDRFDTDALLGLGHLELRRGDRAGALALFRRALAASPGFQQAIAGVSSATAGS